MFDPEFFRNARGVQGRGAAKRNQRARTEIFPALNCVHARGVRHVLVHDFADAQGSVLGCEIEFGTNPFGCHALGAHHIQIYFSAGKRSGIDAAEHDISIGHGRFCAASAVAHWAWIRACAVRSDDDPAESIDPGD